jgi:hypothetical protein
MLQHLCFGVKAALIENSTCNTAGRGVNVGLDGFLHDPRLKGGVNIHKLGKILSFSQ